MKCRRLVFMLVLIFVPVALLGYGDVKHPVYPYSTSGESAIKSVEKITQVASSIQILHSVPEIGMDEYIHSIMRHIVEQRIHIRSIQLEEPNLEDVYLHYVGGRQLE